MLQKLVPRRLHSLLPPCALRISRSLLSVLPPPPDHQRQCTNACSYLLFKVQQLSAPTFLNYPSQPLPAVPLTPSAHSILVACQPASHFLHGCWLTPPLHTLWWLRVASAFLSPRTFKSPCYPILLETRLPASCVLFVYPTLLDFVSIGLPRL